MGVRAHAEGFHIYGQRKRVVDRVLFRAGRNINPFKDAEQWRQLNPREFFGRSFIGKIYPDRRNLFFGLAGRMEVSRENQVRIFGNGPGQTFRQNTRLSADSPSAQTADQARFSRGISS